MEIASSVARGSAVDGNNKDYHENTKARKKNE
jgi:hypothetical protein